MKWRQMGALRRLARNPRPGRAWACVALIVFSAGLVSTFAPLWSQGASTSVAMADPENAGWRAIRTADATFEAWLVARNARTLLHRPHRMFDTEHCAPLQKTMTLGIPMLTMGLLGVPFYVATGDPLLTYNWTLVVWVLLAAVAMYLLVSEWTGIAPAGIVAGLLYAFHPTRLGEVAHPSVIDTTWTVFALFFAQRLFAHGRWRDTIGLAMACSLQIGASFYPLMAAVFFAPPFAIWLFVHYGFRRVRLVQLAVVVLLVACAGVIVFAPYLDARAASDALRRTRFYYAHWSYYLPGNLLYPGLVVIILGIVGSVARRGRSLAGLDGDPRWTLLCGALLVALVAAGPDTGALLRHITGSPSLDFPNLYLLLASSLPGLDTVRAVARLGVVVHVALCALGGMGAAVLIGLSGRRGIWASSILIALTAAYVLWPGALGFEPPYRWTFVEVAPDEEAITFFAELESLENRGPLLELPVDRGPTVLSDSAPRILLSFHHRRRTSACYASYFPDRDQIADLADRLPAPAAVAELERLGFTTVVLHHPLPGMRSQAGRLRRQAQRIAKGSDDSWHLHFLLATDERTAFEIRR